VPTTAPPCSTTRASSRIWTATSTVHGGPPRAPSTASRWRC